MPKTKTRRPISAPPKTSHAERDQWQNRSAPNNGGNSLFIAPGFQWIMSERFLVEASVQLPLFQDLQGKQPELDQSVLIGFRFVY